jgi:HAD superfamily hydrolase (TIGR01490 family)
VTIAFFDLDRTLLSQNSGNLWLKRELRQGHIGKRQALRAFFWMARYHLGLAGMEEAVEEAISTLAGTSSTSLRERTRRFYFEEVRALYRRGARPVLEDHRRRGHTLVLLTASSNYLSELVAEELGLDGVLCTRFEVDANGLHTGRSEGALCFGQGKLAYARAFVAQRQVQLSDCAFYTDSYFDVPVLLEVGHPVVVHPDRRLLKLAQEKSWRVVDWGEPEPAVVRAAG